MKEDHKKLYGHEAGIYCIGEPHKVPPMPSPKSTIEEKCEHMCNLQPCTGCKGDEHEFHCIECRQPLKTFPKGWNVKEELSSPTWQTQEREAWRGHLAGEDRSIDEDDTDYWLKRMESRLSLARKEAYDMGHAVGFRDYALKQLPKIKQEIRSQAFAEVEEMLKGMKPILATMGDIDADDGYTDALSDALTSLSDLKKKGI